MDHGYNVDPIKRCRATTKKDRPCALYALVGIDLCALHAGLAKAKGKPGYGDVSILDAYKRRLVQGHTAAPLRTAARR